MQANITIKNAGGASAAGMTRRFFLGASAAASVPAGAAAAVAAKANRIPQTLESQLDDCVAQLKAILMEMHPQSANLDHWLSRHGDGSFRLSVQGYREFIEYDGPGLYEISDRCSDISECWLQRVDYVPLGYGEPVEGMHYFRSVTCVDGMPVEDVVEKTWPKIIRKIRSGRFPAVHHVSGGTAL